MESTPGIGDSAVTRRDAITGGIRKAAYITPIVLVLSAQQAVAASGVSCGIVGSPCTVDPECCTGLTCGAGMTCE